MKPPTAADFELHPAAPWAILKYQETCHPGRKVTYRVVTLGRTWGDAVYLDDDPTPVTDMDAFYSMDLAHSCEPEQTYARFGITYSEITVTASPQGEVTWEIDWDGPPQATTALPQEPLPQRTGTTRGIDLE